MDLRRTLPRILCLLALAGFALPMIARPSITDVAPVTDGSIELDRQLGSGMGGQVNLVVDNILISGPIFNFGVTPDCNHLGQICLRGTSVRLPQSHVTEDGFGIGSVTVGGQTINQVYYLGGFSFDSPAIVVPRMSSVSGTIVVTAPFTLTGNLLGCMEPMPSSYCSPVQTVFSRSFVGSGTVTYRLRALKGLDIINSTAQYSYDLVGVSLHFVNQPTLPN